MRGLNGFLLLGFRAFLNLNRSGQLLNKTCFLSFFKVEKDILKVNEIKSNVFQ